MGRSLWAVAVALSAALWGPVAGAAPPVTLDLDAALKRLDELYRSESSVARMEMTVHTPRRARTVRMKSWTRGDQKALIVIEAPARDKGTATLRVGDNLWNYLPRIARTIRVPPSMMLGSWMGSDFTNDDLVRSASFRDDFDATLLGPTEDGQGVRVRLDAKPGIVGLWKRIEIVFNRDATVPLRADYYDRRLRHARTMVFDQVKVIEGRAVPMRMTLTPIGKQGHRTVVRYLELDFDAEVPDSTFSLARLERAR